MEENSILRHRSMRAGRWQSSRIAFLVFFVFACSDSRDTAKVLELPPVLVQSVEIRDVMDEIDATGELVPKAHATIAASVPGEVTQIRALEGDAVDEGQVLLEIDPLRRKLEVADSEARVAETRAHLAEKERNQERIRNLNLQDAASRAQLDEAETAVSLARSRLAAAEAHLGLAQHTLSDATVVAPFSCLVARRHVSEGEYLSVGQPLFELVSLNPVEVEFQVAEVDSARIRLGQIVEVSVAPYPDEIFSAQVTMISPTIDPQTRTLRVKGELENLDGRLRPGLFAHIDLGVSLRRNRLLVPEEALLRRAEGTALFRLIDGDRVERIMVQPGIHLDSWVEVEGNLFPGDRVVVRGQRRLVDGGAVSLRTRDGSLEKTSRDVAAPSPSRPPGVGQ